MSTRIHKWCQTLLLCCAAIVSLGWAPGALAVDDLNLFELDANTVDDSGTGLPDDWNNIYSGPNGASVSVFTPDSTPRVFTGGSKDILDISGWSHRLGSSPPKSDLLNAYAAAYPSGQDLIIYFGADRASTNGTVTTGFWFFKNEISVNTNGSFSGEHADGDVLVVVDYDNGGKVGTIVVYEWLGGGLQKIAFSQNLLGTPGLFCDANDNVCATTNGSNITVPWDGTLVPGQFFEGGINITKLIPGAACFSSFMATSRSSTSETAEIKNFILDSFPVCGVSIGKSCEKSANSPVLNPDTNLIHTIFKVPVKNTGSGTIYDVTVTEGAIFNDPLIDKAGSQCSLTKIGANAITPVVLVSLPSNTPNDVKVADQLTGGATLELTIECDSSRNPLSNTINVKAKTSATSTVFGVPPASHTTGTTETCGVTLNTAVTVEKSCKSVTMIGGVEPSVCVDIKVTNASQQDLRITQLDDVESTGQTVNLLSAFVNANGGSDILQQAGASGGKDVAVVQRCYTPTAGLVDLAPKDVSYTDVAKTAGVGVFDGAPTGVVDSNTASCPLCPAP